MRHRYRVERRASLALNAVEPLPARRRNASRLKSKQLRAFAQRGAKMINLPALAYAEFP